jgi:lysophospholipase L1-like esterase
MRRWWFVNVGQRVNWRLGRRAQRVHGRGPLLVAMGDSLTDPGSGSTLPWQVWLRRVTREGYRTLNLGNSGDTTADLLRRIEQTLYVGQPDVVVLFGGANDAFRGFDPAETERNVARIMEWLRDHGIRDVVVMTPGLLNWGQDASKWVAALDGVREVLREVAERYDARFVDLAQFLRDRIDRGEDPDFARVPYRQARSWHVMDGDPHLNAYGQRLAAQAFLAATADWRRDSHHLASRRTRTGVTRG